jgi:lipopolysaccharide export system protein LptA
MPRRLRLLTLSAAGLAGAFALAALVGRADAQLLRGHDTNAPVDFAADHIEVQDRADRVVVAGHVEVRQSGMLLTAARLTVAYHDGDGLAIDRLDASGGVIITRGNERASGDVAIYDLNRKLITLVGHVRLNQGANQLGGSRLVIDLVSGRSTVDGVGAPAGIQNGSNGRVTGTFQVRQGDNQAAPARPNGE